ncbi:MAG TPA: PTS system mannose/fructose/sorbose family transporter subunit IID [Gemmatimonadales bacterium]|jgi:PTS system mannose-specific IID component|nr:PTS system mannose/fructose/sorbose family transporter subunit IID [Gemmatimonadales bacterium]
MSGQLRALLRLFAVQGAWNYERMLGVGMGYASEPLLEDLKRADPQRHSEAVVRSAEFFNCNPNLAGLALGAEVRAEYDGAPGAQVARLRIALCSPLGALGDQLFWAGLVPALVGLALAGVALGAGLWAILGFLLGYNAVRLYTAQWALRTGLAAGIEIGAAISRSWIPKAAAAIGPAAGFGVGFAVPLVATWFLAPFPARAALGALGLTALGLGAGYVGGARYGALRYALAAVLMTLLVRLVLR